VTSNTRFQPLRPRLAAAAGGVSKSQMYNLIRAGLWVRPVPLGPTITAFPAGEIEALNAARVTGATDDEIRGLVDRLHAARAHALRDVLGDGA
jgi:prophage regulatory protein